MLFRIGQGFDIHNIHYNNTTTTSVKPVILGGVLISKNMWVNAHSDGDTLLHALIDSILGALGKEDIGDLFPPSSQQWKDISSIQLLNMVLERTEYEKNWRFNNIDITIVLQEPNLGSLKAEIKAHLKKQLNLSEDFPIAIKAKTFEKPQEQIWVYSTISLILNT